MTLREFALLSDENIHPDVVAFLRSEGIDVLDVREASLTGASDEDLLHRAVEQDRVVLTHDSDFGTLAMLRGEPVVGIVYVRPGHIRPEFTIGTLRTLYGRVVDVMPPFIIVAQRSEERVRIRVRKVVPG